MYSSFFGSSLTDHNWQKTKNEKVLSLHIPATKFIGKKQLV